MQLDTDGHLNLYRRLRICWLQGHFPAEFDFASKFSSTVGWTRVKERLPELYATLNFSSVNGLQEIL